MINWLVKLTTASEKRINVTSSVYSVIAGLLFGLLLMIITNPAEAVPAFLTILFGIFSEGLTSIGLFLYYAAPIILTGLAVGFAFRTGLFNIGASGQVMVGGFVAIYIGIKWTFLPSGLHWIVAFAAAGIAGGIWAAIPGILKAYRNVHEVVSTIMMNYIAMLLTTYLVEVNISLYNSTRNENINVSPNAVLPTLGLDKIFVDSPINIGIVFALAATLIIWFLLEKTTFGYQLKAVGFNRDASKYAGINDKKNIVLSMIISGILAGLAGGVLYLTLSGKHIRVEDVLIQEGYLGIPVALIGLNNPLGIFFAGLFVEYIKIGGYYMQTFNFVPEIIDIIIAVIIYVSALVQLLKQFILYYKKRHEAKHQLVQRGDGQ